MIFFIRNHGNKMKKRTCYFLITILLIGLLTISFIFFVKENRDFIATKGGTIITLWDNYIIFEDYRGISPPKHNYIKTSKVNADYGYVTVIRKKNSSIVVLTDRTTVEVNLPNICQVDILKPCGDTILVKNIYSDKLIDLIVDCYAYRGRYIPIITEYARDSVITTEFEPNSKIFTVTSLGEKHTSSTTITTNKFSF